MTKFKTNNSNKFCKKPLIFFAISKFFYNNKRKNFSRKFIISSSTVNLLKLSSSIEIDNIIQEGKVMFKKNATVGLPKLSKLIDSVISKRQGDQRKLS